MSAPDPTQIAGGFVDALTRSTALRGQAMQNLDQAHQAQQKALTIEASRVASRYGADSAQSKAIQARVAAHAARGRIVTAERQRTQIAAPNAQPDAFIVYGRVLDSAGNPKKGVKVDATGASGALVTSTQSGGDGSFQLSVPASAVAPRQSATLEQAVPAEKVDATVGPLKPGDSTAKPNKTAATAAPPTPVTRFQLALTDSNTSTIYRYPEVFQVTAGVVAYREIAMPSPAG